MPGRLEHRSQPVIPPGAFVWRLARACLIWLMVTSGGLVLGMTGYAVTEGMSMIDAFVNAAMILSGMGPVSELKSDAGKIFAGIYAILSGLLIVIATSFILSPVVHRVLHLLHAEEDSDAGKD